MKKVLIKSNERGHANHGWLDTYHTFSFANYYNPNRMNFGLLRVLNDDTVAGGMGFGRHPHENMEIISIPLSGNLEHQDSMGNKTIIAEGEVQIMSAGTGIFHSEKNADLKNPVKFLQIWVIPDKMNISPRYDQQKLDLKPNHLATIVSPLNTSDLGIKINQNAWFSLVNLEQEKSVDYQLNQKGNGVFVFNLEGQISIENEILDRRDGLGIYDFDNNLNLLAKTNAKVLVIEVPMR